MTAKRAFLLFIISLTLLVLAIGFGWANATIFVQEASGSATIKLTVEEAKACEEEGGCGVVSQKTMDLINKAIHKLQHDAETCESSSMRSL